MVQIAQQPPRAAAQTAGRALRVMELVARSERSLSLREVADLAGLNKSAAYRMLRELQNGEFIRRDTDTRGYVVGSRLVALSALVIRKLRVGAVARPVMERVAARTGETVSLHARHGRDRICVEVVEGGHPIRRVVPIGESLPLYAGVSGKVILAFLGSSDIQSVLNQAESDGEDVGRIRIQLEMVRNTGYLGAVGDRLPGVGGLAAPIFDSTGIVAALTISGPADRWDEAAIQSAARATLEDTGQLSQALGYADPETEE